MEKIKSMFTCVAVLAISLLIWKKLQLYKSKRLIYYITLLFSKQQELAWYTWPKRQNKTYHNEMSMHKWIHWNNNLSWLIQLLSLNLIILIKIIKHLSTMRQLQACIFLSKRKHKTSQLKSDLVLHETMPKRKIW